MVDAAALVLRIVIGTVFIGHGWPKVFGDPEGIHGRAGTARMLGAKGIPLPALAAWAVALGESVGGALVLGGFLTRLALVPLALILLGAVTIVKWRKGFIDGWDWPYGLLGCCIAALLLGPGELSIDAVIGLED